MTSLPHHLNLLRVQNLRYHISCLFCPCVVQKATAHVGIKALNKSYQAQKGFCGIFIGIPQHKKGYILYVPHRRKIIFLYDVVFDENFSSDLACMSQLYA